MLPSVLLPLLEKQLSIHLNRNRFSIFAIVTLVGGTVGGYITFAGGHRLLDAGVKGVESLPEVTKSSVTGILVTGIMRVALFLAVLGVVSQGLAIDPENPPASVFYLAAGDIGYRIFGVIMWAAAITSVVGAAYTSVSFIRSFSPVIEKYHNWIIILFILVSTLTFALVGRPVTDPPSRRCFKCTYFATCARYTTYSCLQEKYRRGL